MTIKELQEYAQKASRTKDTKYNTGRKHCIDGYTFTDEAIYFMTVEGIERDVINE